LVGSSITTSSSITANSLTSATSISTTTIGVTSSINCPNITASTALITPSINSGTTTLTMNNLDILNAVVNDTSNNVTADRVRALNNRAINPINLSTSNTVVINVSPPAGTYIAMYGINATTSISVAFTYSIFVSSTMVAYATSSLVAGQTLYYGDSYRIVVSTAQVVSVAASVPTVGTGSVVENSFLNLIPIA
jgi:hypothetical protein